MSLVVCTYIKQLLIPVRYSSWHLDTIVNKNPQSLHS